MKKTAILLLALVVATVTALAAPKSHKLAESWKNETFERREFRKLLIVGITDDRDVRRNFENKFVSHLRGRGIEGVTSHSLVPDLTDIENERQIVDAIAEQEVDGAISVRVVSLTDIGESEWSDAWRAAMGPEDKLRTLIEESLPIKREKLRHYGVEVALWDVLARSRVWAARTDVYTRKQLKNGGGELVQLVMAELKDAGLL